MASIPRSAFTAVLIFQKVVKQGEGLKGKHEFCASPSSSDSRLALEPYVTLVGSAGVVKWRRPKFLRYTKMKIRSQNLRSLLLILQTAERHSVGLNSTARNASKITVPIVLFYIIGIKNTKGICIARALEKSNWLFAEMWWQMFQRGKSEIRLTSPNQVPFTEDVPLNTIYG